MTTAAIRTIQFDNNRLAKVLRRLSDSVLWYTLSIAILLVIWQAIAMIFHPKFLPSFTDVVVRLFTEIASGQILQFLSASLLNFVLGFGISAVFGIIVGIIMGVWRPAEIALSPYVYAFMTAPSIVFAPLFFAIFGLSPLSIVALIVQYAIFIVIINTMTGIKQVRPELRDMARSFGANRFQETLLVVARAAMPLTLAGVRLGLGRSIKGMVNGELLIALIGLGGLIDRYGNRFDAEGVLAIVLLLIIVSLILLRLFALVDRRVNGWIDQR